MPTYRRLQKPDEHSRRHHTFYGRLADSLHQWATHRHIDLDRHRQPDLTGKLGGEHNWKDGSRFASVREHCPMSNPSSPRDPAPVARPASAPTDDSVLAAFAASGVIAAATGVAAGLVWGGFGGRIAMRVVFLTSNERVRGVTSDDGFEIGTISGASMFLLIFAAILGGMAGFGVGIIRMVTSGPTWAVAIGTSLAAASFAGAGIVHTDGVDFRLLDPLWLTVGLFVLIPGLWGATVVVVTERLLRSRVVEGLPQRVHRRYWGATGWILLAGITTFGIRGLVADIATLT